MLRQIEHQMGKYFRIMLEKEIMSEIARSFRAGEDSGRNDVGKMKG